MNAVTILSVGKATQDVFLKSGEFDPKQEGSVAYTHLPLGAKLDVDDVVFASGGNAGNAAVTFARQGFHSRYLWLLGEDPASQAILADLDKEGVDTSAVAQDSAYRASYSTVLISPDGERTVLNFHGSLPQPDGRPLDLSQLTSADWLYLSSLGSLALLERMVTAAAAAGVKIMLNPAGVELSDPAKLRSLLPDIDVLALNKEEMQSLVSGRTLEELVLHGLHFCPVVIVSDGPRGACASDGQQLISAGTYEDVPVVDRTGAGDAFASGFLSAWAASGDLAKAITLASANSTSVVRQVGAKQGILYQGASLHAMPLRVKPLTSDKISNKPNVKQKQI